LNGVVTFIPGLLRGGTRDGGDESIERRFDQAVLQILVRVARERPVDERRLAVTDRVADDGVAVGHACSMASKSG
jgi:hypothetical protein